jgi:7-cyano-7-deazaguanine reductase
MKKIHPTKSAGEVPVFDRIAPELLRVMPYAGGRKKIDILVETSEFTCLCPWSGLPDFARLAVRYVPDAKVVELKALKFYIQSYRMVGILHEDAANRICDDLAEAARPRELTVEITFNLRGGIKTTVTRQYLKK